MPPASASACPLITAPRLSGPRVALAPQRHYAWSPRSESNPRPTPYQGVAPNGSGCIFGIGRCRLHGRHLPDRCSGVAVRFRLGHRAIAPGRLRRTSAAGHSARSRHVQARVIRKGSPRVNHVIQNQPVPSPSHSSPIVRGLTGAVGSFSAQERPPCQGGCRHFESRLPLSCDVLAADHAVDTGRAERSSPSIRSAARPLMPSLS